MPVDTRPIRAVMTDFVIDVCRYLPAYTLDAVWEMPCADFWRVLDKMRRDREERMKVAAANPAAALALFGLI